MDFIREELLRQKDLLTVLMTGKNREQTEEYEPAEEDFGWRRILGGQPTFERAVPGYHGDPWEEFAPEQRDPAKTEHDRRQYAPRAGRHWTQSRAEEAAGAVFVMPHRDTAGQRADVRELSRKIQQDARRYDGGFSIY